MSRYTLTNIASISLILTLWMFELTIRTGIQVWTAIGVGLGAAVIIRATVAAARATDRPAGGGEDR